MNTGKIGDALKVLETLLADAIDDCASWNTTKPVRGSVQTAAAHMASLITCLQYLERLKKS
jgi:hypothetical protein